MSLHNWQMSKRIKKQRSNDEKKYIYKNILFKTRRFNAVLNKIDYKDVK